jgi:hypothetical protein
MQARVILAAALDSQKDEMGAVTYAYDGVKVLYTTHAEKIGTSHKYIQLQITEGRYMIG